MARYDQHMGLNEWAKEFVVGDPKILYHEESIRTYPDGQEEAIARHPVMGTTVSCEVSDHCYEGMFGDQYPLTRYVFDDGRVFEERIQSDSWSSGPVFYLALVEIKGAQELWVQESLWTELLGEYDDEDGSDRMAANGVGSTSIDIDTEDGEAGQRVEA